MLISRLTNDVQALDQLVTEGMQTLFSSTLTLIGIAVILILLDPGLALVTFLTFPLLLAGSVLFRIASIGRVPAHARADRAWSPPTSRRRCRASGSCARSARRSATPGASRS